MHKGLKVSLLGCLKDVFLELSLALQRNTKYITNINIGYSIQKHVGSKNKSSHQTSFCAFWPFCFRLFTQRYCV